MDGVVFWTVVAARVLVPLAIPRFPLPAMLAALVIDGIDQTIFQTFTSLDLTGYQSYDKALDVYYLSIAYTATLRNWTHLTAFGVSRFLYFYRLVGVVLFELTQVRAVLLVFPNTFEYFFDFYEAIRVRWDPLRMTRNLVIGAAAFIWIFIKLPQEWWIHVAQLDATDTIKTVIFGVSADCELGRRHRQPSVGARRDRRRCRRAARRGVVGHHPPVASSRPPADHRRRRPADAGRPGSHRSCTSAHRRAADRPRAAREVVLLSLVSVIFGRMLPNVEATPLETAVGVALVVIASTAISEAMVRRGTGWDTAVLQFSVMLAVNLVVVMIGIALVAALTSRQIEHALIFVLLVTLVVTLYDRYRPIHVARFSAG